MKLAALLVILATGTAVADDAAPKPPPKPPKPLTPANARNRIAHAVLLGIGAGVYITWETVAKDALAPNPCRWCSVNSFDARIRDSLVWGHRDSAAALSNLTGYAMAPLAAGGLLLLATSGLSDDQRWLAFGDDILTVAEAAMYTQLVVQGFKYSFGRQRPYAHYTPDAYAKTSDDNLSFLSGHTALAFSIATATGTIAHRHHYHHEAAIWAVGMGLAATTAYLRVAADKHYATDVLAGGVLGAAGGILVPRITGGLAAAVAPVEGGGGVALVSGRF